MMIPSKCLLAFYTLIQGLSIRNVHIQCLDALEVNSAPGLNQEVFNSSVDSEAGEVFLRQLKACHWNHVVFISDGSVERNVIDLLLELFHSDSVYVVQYDMSPSVSYSYLMQDIVWRCYQELSLVNFLWISKEPVRIIELMQKVFERDLHSRGVMMPHHVHFILISSADVVMDLNRNSVNSIFDNVALFATDQHSLSLELAFTLMHDANKQRRFERIVIEKHTSTNRSQNSCRMFPNVVYGMNGRTLIGAAKGWKPYLKKEPDPITGKLKFVGYLIDLLDFLAADLNFTYILTPEPGQDDNVTWDEFEQFLGESVVDFGASAYMINSVAYMNYSVTYPIIYSNISGVYVSPEDYTDERFFRLFKMEVYILLLGCLLFTMIFYLVIPTEAYNNHSDIDNMNNTENIHNGRTGYKFPTGDMDNMNSIEDDDKSRIDSKFPGEDLSAIAKRDTSTQESMTCSLGKRVLEAFFGFFATLVGHGCFPDPLFQSARFLLWFWCMMLVILHATFVGNLTASKVSGQGQPPFSTFEEMMDRGDYRWGLVSSSVFIYTMRESPEDTLLRKLYDRMEDFAAEDPRVRGTIDELMELVVSENFVALLLSNDANDFNSNPDFPKLQRIPQPLATTNLGMVLPKYSKLTNIFSQIITRAADSGVLEALSHKHITPRYLSHTQVDSCDGNCTVQLEDMFHRFAACAIGTLFAMIVLLVELAAAKIRSSKKSPQKSVDIGTSI